MSWFSLISAALQIVKWMIDRAERRSLISEGEQRALLKQYQAGERTLQNAIVARDDVRDRIDSDGLSDDDFRD